MAPGFILRKLVVAINGETILSQTESNLEQQSDNVSSYQNFFHINNSIFFVPYCLFFPRWTESHSFHVTPKDLHAGGRQRGIIYDSMIGKKSKSVFDFLTYSRETWFSFFYVEVECLVQPIGPSDKSDRVSKFYNSLSFGAKQNALRQIFFALWFFKDLFMKIANWIFFWFFMILSRIKKGVYLHFLNF